MRVRYRLNILSMRSHPSLFVSQLQSSACTCPNPMARVSKNRSMPMEKAHTPVNPSSLLGAPHLSANPVRCRFIRILVKMFTHFIRVPPAIQLAKLSCFSPIITTASLKHEAYLKTLGATHVIDRNTPTIALAGRIAGITNRPLDVVFDSVSSAETQKLSHDLTATGGMTVFVVAEQIDVVPGKEFVHALGTFGFPHTRPLGEKLYAHLTQLVEDGHIKVCFFRPRCDYGRLIALLDCSPTEWSFSLAV